MTVVLLHQHNARQKVMQLPSVVDFGNLISGLCNSVGFVAFAAKIRGASRHCEFGEHLAVVRFEASSSSALAIDV